MEAVLEVYQRLYDPFCPVVCVDETNRQWMEQRSIPANPGKLLLVDYECRCCGVADLFEAFEPLGSKRIVNVTATEKLLISLRSFERCLMFMTFVAQISFEESHTA